MIVFNFPREENQNLSIDSRLIYPYAIEIDNLLRGIIEMYRLANNDDMIPLFIQYNKEVAQINEFYFEANREALKILLKFAQNNSIPLENMDSNTMNIDELEKLFLVVSIEMRQEYKEKIKILKNV